MSDNEGSNFAKVIEKQIQELMASQKISREEAIKRMDEVFEFMMNAKAQGRNTAWLSDDEHRRVLEAVNLRQPIPADIAAKLNDPHEDLLETILAELKVRKSQ
ncbi:MAG TPA: hypothetical protein VFZ48_01285 [Candidatus Saccharimonadales bacterium]